MKKKNCIFGMILNQMLFIYSIKNSKIFLVVTFIASFKIVATETLQKSSKYDSKRSKNKAKTRNFRKKEIQDDFETLKKGKKKNCILGLILNQMLFIYSLIF